MLIDGTSVGLGALLRPAQNSVEHLEELLCRLSGARGFTMKVKTEYDHVGIGIIIYIYM